MAKPINTNATINVKKGGDYNVTEDGDSSASGTLLITDPDPGDAGFKTVSAKSLAGVYGTFTFNSSTGAWTYALDNTKTATQTLTAGQIAHDTLTVTSLDGTASPVIDVTVTGANDSATITGTVTGNVIEAGGVNNATAGSPTASGTV